MYHPLIGYDVERVREEFGEGVVMSEAQKTALVVATAAATAPKILKVKIKGVPYVFVPSEGGTKFDIFADDGTGKPTGNKVGEVDAEGGKPKAGTAKFYKVKQ
jgi:hypothetical protein